MGFQRFQFQFPDRCLETQRIQLTLASLGIIVRKIINKQPGENKETIVNRQRQPFSEIAHLN